MRWFWALTGANLLVCALLILFIFGVLSALASFAAGVTEWPGFLLLGIGLVLTVTSWLLIRLIEEQSMSVLGYGLNALPFVVYLTVTVGIGSLFLHATRRLFLIPSGFHGELYVVHGSKEQGARGVSGIWRTTYKVPINGVLVTDDLMPKGGTLDSYSYIYPDGHRESLGDAGPGTLPDTTENRRSVKEVVVYNPTFSPKSEVSQCEIEEVSIGTRAFLLDPRPYVTPTDPFNDPHLRCK